MAKAKSTTKLKLTAPQTEALDGDGDGEAGGLLPGGRHVGSMSKAFPTALATAMEIVALRAAGYLPPDADLGRARNIALALALETQLEEAAAAAEAWLADQPTARLGELADDAVAGLLDGDLPEPPFALLTEIAAADLAPYFTTEDPADAQPTEETPGAEAPPAAEDPAPQEGLADAAVAETEAPAEDPAGDAPVADPAPASPPADDAGGAVSQEPVPETAEAADASARPVEPYDGPEAAAIDLRKLHELSISRRFYRSPAGYATTTTGGPYLSEDQAELWRDLGLAEDRPEAGNMGGLVITDKGRAFLREMRNPRSSSDSEAGAIAQP